MWYGIELSSPHRQGQYPFRRRMNLVAPKANASSEVWKLYRTVRSLG